MNTTPTLLRQTTSHCSQFLPPNERLKNRHGSVIHVLAKTFFNTFFLIFFLAIFGSHSLDPQPHDAESIFYITLNSYSKPTKAYQT